VTSKTLFQRACERNDTDHDDQLHLTSIDRNIHAHIYHSIESTYVCCKCAMGDNGLVAFCIVVVVDKRVDRQDIVLMDM
jgi:hypothetical protein